MNNIRYTKRVRSRLLFLSFILTLLLCFLGGRVYYIKTVHGQEYETAAKTQQVNKYDSSIPPNRGSILDRNSQPMAVSTTVYNVAIDPRIISGLSAEVQDKILTVLSDNLSADYEGTDYATLKSYVTIDQATQKPAVDSNFKYIAKKISRELKEKMEAEGAVKGVVYEKDTQRNYKLDTVACHVIGFTRGDVQWGLEKVYDSDLSGTPGRSFITFDGSSNASTQEFPATDGNTIVTTIDYTIQQYAEAAVQEAVEGFNPENVGVIVMNPNTAEVIAMASAPNFNSNSPSVPIELEENADFKTQWEAMSETQQYAYLEKTWTNFNVTSTYEPGSVYKPMVVAAALEENIISANDTFFCTGHKQVADREIPCHLRTGHGTIDVEGVLANSCNIGMMDIAEKMGKELFYQYQLDFGFGSETGIDLPSEVSSASLKNLMYSLERIGPTELATMSFGQSFNATSLQVITAFSAVINGGKLMKPYVVSQVLDTSGAVVKENKPEVVRRVISQETSDIVRNMMLSTLEEGTGKKAKIDGYYIGGKTGTAQQGDRSKGEYALSYITYFPKDNPQYVVMSVIYKPEGGDTASPAQMTKNLMENIIKYKNIEPDYDVATKTQSSASSSDTKKITIDDYTGESLYSTVASLDSLNIEYEVVGTGNTVTNQAPHGGTEMEQGSKIILYVEKGEGDTGSIPVPDVKGKTYEEAVELINNAGLYTVVDGEKEGVVVSQEPKSGISVEAETEVKLTFGEEETTKDNTGNTE